MYNMQAIHTSMFVNATVTTLTHLASNLAAREVGCGLGHALVEALEARHHLCSGTCSCGLRGGL